MGKPPPITTRSNLSSTSICTRSAKSYCPVAHHYEPPNYIDHISNVSQVEMEQQKRPLKVCYRSQISTQVHMRKGSSSTVETPTLPLAPILMSKWLTQWTPYGFEIQAWQGVWSGYQPYSLQKAHTECPPDPLQ